MGMREEVQFFFFLPVTLNLGLGCTLQMQINEGMHEHSHDARCWWIAECVVGQACCRAQDGGAHYCVLIHEQAETP